MKEFNFDALRNLPVPEDWIENALAIPEEEEKKPAVIPFWRKPRFIAMAASLMLVTALSIALYLSMGNKPPVTVKPNSKPSATEIIWSTDENGETVATEVVIIPDPDEQQNATQPTEKKSPVAQFFERIFGGTDPTAPTPSPTESGRRSPNQKPAPTEKGKPSPTAKDTPTEKDDLPVESTDPPYSTTAPTEIIIEEPPTVTPWEDSTTSPTESGDVIIHGPGGWDVTEAPWDPDATEPTPKPTQPKPTQSKYKDSVRISASVYSISKINQDGGVVYCRIYDDNGNVYGDGDLYSDQHLATLTLTFDGGSLSYSPRDHGILPEDGYYHFEFYTRAGRSLSKGNAYLSAE